MSLEAIWDNVARQMAAVSGIKSAHATRASSSDGAVKEYAAPEAINDGPTAVVDWEDSEIAHSGSGMEITVHRFMVAVYIPVGATRPTAVRELAPIFERAREAFDLNYLLYSSASAGVEVTGALGPDDVTDDNGRDFVFVTLMITAKEHIHRSHQVGPSS